MTANLVSGFGPMKDIISPKSAGIGSTGGADFSDILKSNTGKEQDVPQAKESKDINVTDAKSSKETRTNKVEQTEPQSTVNKEDTSEAKADKPEGINDSQKTETDDVTQEISDEVIETIQTAVMSMVAEVAEAFDATVQEVEAAVEAIGLDVVQVLDASNVPMIAVELTDATDTYDIMTDEELFTDVKMLMEKANELSDDVATKLDITPEDLSEAIEILTNQDKVADTENAGRLTEVDSSEESDMTVASKATEADTVLPALDGKKSEQSKSNLGRNDSHSHEGSNLTQTLADTLKDVVMEKVEEAPVAYSTSAEQIMEQVTENLKLTMTEDITEMEMQLHPASLGNIRVQVAAKDGVITASFTTQNEEVKAALETQLVQLKEQFDEQGIKVAAVEVTVGSHAFERNLNEEGGRNNQSSEAEAKKKRVRGINLNGVDLDEMDELIDEEDKVVADMMARQGNTVDYMA